MAKTGMFLLGVALGFLAAAAQAVEIAGPWWAEFENPRGHPNYLR